MLADEAETGGLPWPTAREEAIAPTRARTAAMRNSEQRIRRQSDEVSTDVDFGFVIMGLRYFGLMGREWTRTTDF